MRRQAGTSAALDINHESTINMHRLTLLLAIALLGSTATLQAQSTLESLVQEAGFSWLLGKWKASNSEGQTLRQSFSWDLKKNVVVGETIDPEYQVKTLTGIAPDREEPVLVGFSSRGGAVRGVWRDRDGSPLLTLRASDREGRTWRGAILYKKIDGDTMEVRVFGLDEVGEPKPTPEARLTYRRE